MTDSIPGDENKTIKMLLVKKKFLKIVSERKEGQHVHGTGANIGLL